MEEKHICDYGCGKEAIYQFKNGKWCCSNHYKKCTKYREIQKIKITGKNNPMYGRIKDKNPFYGKHHTKECIEENKQFNIDYWSKPENKNRQSIKRKKWFEDPINYEKHCKRMKEIQNRPDVKKRNKENGLIMWSNKKFVKKIKEIWNIRPNKPETLLINLFKDLNLNYEYTGDFSFMISGKNPDFTNYKTKKIIDFFGDYFHGEEFRKDGKSNIIHVQQRIEHFEKNGYKCLIIWENELKEIDKVIHKIMEFEKI